MNCKVLFFVLIYLQSLVAKMHFNFSNFMVRKAVGSTPAIMGNKIKQTYFHGDRYFEIMIDTGSSAVAAGVIRICNGG